ncbi:MAG TPA: SRPBCC domain-containing protein [Solirubrobacteraceae bacterium]|nr:SRPBCC domain-containing protein [Solirubrobacteraceae bacterium]
MERVWRAVTDPAELECWFVVAAPWTPELGETFGAGGQQREIVALEEPFCLAWTWADERYQFDLQVEGESCLLTFTHVFDARHGTGAQHADGDGCVLVFTHESPIPAPRTGPRRAGTAASPAWMRCSQACR